MSAKTDESGVENSIWLNYFRFLGPIAEWEKKVGSMDLVRLSGGLLVKKKKSTVSTINIRPPFSKGNAAYRFALELNYVTKQWVGVVLKIVKGLIVMTTRQPLKQIFAV
jgi:hypothetical protein